MKRATPITAIAVSTANPIAKPILSLLASDGLSRRDREYACEAMGDEATGQADGAATAPEGIEPAALEEWFSEHAPGAVPPLEFERIAGGHSNLTYRVERRRRASAGRCAARRSASASAPPTTWAVSTRSSRRSAPTEVPVAPVVGLCEDESVNGAPFYVMEFVEGPILRGLAEAEVFPDEADRRAIGERVADTLVAIHDVDPDAVGLGDLGRKEDYVARQLHRWQGQWEKSKTRELPAIDRVHERLAARIPEQGPATIVHGDYRLDNMILTPTGRGRGGGRLGALHPRRPARRRRPADGLLARSRVRNSARSASRPTSPRASRPAEELAARYAERSGRDLSQLDFYVALGYWKLAIILEGVYARYAAGGYGKVDAGFEAVREPGRAAGRDG